MIRVRFAPSPTGALHIGGVRTALFNFLFARKNGGQFLLRIEDTDQGRYVPGAEDYIIETLKWAGLVPDEGVGFGGPHGPYRQSDRKAIYGEYAQKLLATGHAYLAFDSTEELEILRAAEPNFTVTSQTRSRLKNSLTLSENDVNSLIASGLPSVIRLKVEPGQTIVIDDLIRGRVEFQSSELDDKVLLKADGMPTYHLANIVDDHLMEISHVIRGEEWLPSTAHHVLLYRGFGWEATMPRFSHLPLILKPVGNGKLSKRDGAKFGMPVFPLSWAGATADESFEGFREAGFLPEAMVNFLALLGWHPGGEQEIFSIDELIAEFDLDKISKSGARFDFEKAKWFNHKYIQALSDAAIADKIRPLAEAAGGRTDAEFLTGVARLMKERVSTVPDFVREGHYFFRPIAAFDLETVSKKWNAAAAAIFGQLIADLENLLPFEAAPIEELTKKILAENSMKPGDLFPLLRIALAGTMKGPAVFEMAGVLGKEETIGRLKFAVENWG